jgi:serine phosphatase RsbU (regulator of sigma subunit)
LQRHGARQLCPSPSTSSISTAPNWCASQAPTTSPLRSRHPPPWDQRSFPKGSPPFKPVSGSACPAASQNRSGSEVASSACCSASEPRVTALDDIARQGAAALELANDYTDLIEAARRRKPTTPAAEVQQNLFPPRIARVSGAHLAGGLIPTYEVGGDWFDFVENRDGTWIAIADAAGTGPTAAGLGAAALGALRAARRSRKNLEQALQAMHETVRRLGNTDFYVSALVARWYAATSTVTWINCGHPDGYLIDVDGNIQELGGPIHPPLGVGNDDATFTPTSRQLSSDERLILVTDGITQRPTKDGGSFGIHGIRRALGEIENPSAAMTAMSILQAVSDCWREPLEDDGTVVVLQVQ